MRQSEFAGQDPVERKSFAKKEELRKSALPYLLQSWLNIKL